MPIGQAKFGLLGGVVDPGKLELIETIDVTTSGTATFTSLGTYNVHFATYNNITVDNNSNELVVELSSDGGSSWIRSGGDYQFGSQYGTASGSFLDPNSSSANNFPLTHLGGGATLETINGYVYLYNLVNDQFSYSTMHSSYMNSSGIATMYFGYAGLEDATNRTIDAIRFLSKNSPFGITGTVSLYGIAES